MRIKRNGEDADYEFLCEFVDNLEQNYMFDEIVTKFKENEDTK